MDGIPIRSAIEQVAEAPDHAKYETVLRILEDSLGALKTLHEAGLVHRDLQPNNILTAV